MQANKKVFEKFTDISIPKNAQVIKDEYQDMGQDYGKVLELNLDHQSQKDFEEAIKRSCFFDPSAFTDNNIVPEHYMHSKDERRGIWYRNKSGYAFYGSTLDEQDNVIVTIDTIKKVAKFQYLAD